MSWRTWLSRPLNWLIRICGWSAILFVTAIFVFIFREALPVITRGFDFKEFFTSPNWRPDSQIRPQYGILALLLGTGRRNGRLDGLGRSVGPRRGGLHFGILHGPTSKRR